MCGVATIVHSLTCIVSILANVEIETQAMTNHLILCQDIGKVATLPYVMAGVKCPSLLTPINKKGE